MTREQRRIEETGLVTEDDVNEIKQDIASFRFELIDLLKRNGFKSEEKYKESSGWFNLLVFVISKFAFQRPSMNLASSSSPSSLFPQPISILMNIHSLFHAFTLVNYLRSNQSEGEEP